jgi:hypothetical protein
MFDEWLNGIEKKWKQGYGLDWQLYVGRFGKVGTMLYLTMLVSQILCRLYIWYSLDLRMVPITPEGSAVVYGHWMQPSAAQDFYT